MFININDVFVYNNDNVYISFCVGGGLIYFIFICVYLVFIFLGNNDIYNFLEFNVNIVFENFLIVF